MSIRQALHRQAILASRKRGKGTRIWYGSNAIFAMMAAFLGVVCAIEVLRG